MIELVEIMISAVDICPCVRVIYDREKKQRLKR
jgi:hypothetical protein